MWKAVNDALSKSFNFSNGLVNPKIRQEKEHYEKENGYGHPKPAWRDPTNVFDVLGPADDRTHALLDAAGMAPAPVGTAADMTNSYLYSLKGEADLAGLSLLSAAPLVGEAATVGKNLKHAEPILDEAAEVVTTAAKGGSKSVGGAKSSAKRKLAGKVDDAAGTAGNVAGIPRRRHNYNL